MTNCERYLGLLMVGVKSKVSTFRVRLVEGVEKWKDGKFLEDGKVRGWKIFSFPSCVFGWRGGKVREWKTFLFD